MIFYTTKIQNDSNIWYMKQLKNTNTIVKKIPA